MEKGLAEMLRCERPGEELRELVWKVVCVVWLETVHQPLP